MRQRITLIGISIIAIGITGCGGGSDGSPSVAIPPPVSETPPPPTSGLLTNEQLRTAVDNSAGLVIEVEATWFAENTSIIRSLTEDEDFGDLSFLDGDLANKRIVMLGESSHGVKQYSQAKVRLIKYLHERLGYNVIAFESGLYECEIEQRSIERGDARGAMAGCIFGVWDSAEVLELFRYVEATQDTSAPMRITGFDVQYSGIRARPGRRAAYIASLVEKASPSYAVEVSNLETLLEDLVANAGQADSATSPSIRELRQAVPTIANNYLVLADYLLANETAITADGTFSRHDVLVAAQVARTAPFLAQQTADRFDLEQSIRHRDEGMALNFIELANAIYPNEKIIGWAHNAHIRHRGEGFVLDGNMGKHVHDALADEMYTVGFYMYRGQHAFNDRSVQNVRPPIDNSLEAIFYSRRLAYLWLDLENADLSSDGANWVRSRSVNYAWGYEPITMQLNEEYDGLLMIDTAEPPDYL
ncbi:MAG: erythromycin esterase family protein [Pseudomonadota bacterium]